MSFSLALCIPPSRKIIFFGETFLEPISVLTNTEGLAELIGDNALVETELVLLRDLLLM